MQQNAIICNSKNVLYKVYIWSIYHNDEKLLLYLLQMESLFSKLYTFLSFLPIKYIKKKQIQD